MILLVLCLLLSLIWPGLVQAQWSEPAIDGSLRSAPLDPPPVTGSTFYVDGASIGGTCNNANAGTITSPWCTIDKAMTTLTAGQRAYIRAGTYNTGTLIPTNSGTAGNYITFEGYPTDAMPVINCTGHTWCIDQFSGGTQRSYIVIKRLDLHSSTQEIMSQLNTTSHHWWFVGNKIHDNRPGTPDSNAGFPCLRFHGMNNVVSNNEGYNCKANFAGAGGGGHHNIFEFNTIHGNGRHVDDEGAIKCGTLHHACVIRYNHAYDNWREPTSPRPCDASPCLGVTGLYHDFDENSAGTGTFSYFYNNISHDNDTGCQVYASDRVRVFNNICYHNGWTAGQAAGFGLSNFGHGIMIDPAATTTDIQVYNNIAYNNWSRGFSYGGTLSAELISRNNIAMNNGLSSVGADFAYFNHANGNFNNDLMFNNVGGTLIIMNGTSYSTLAAVQARGGNTTWLQGVHANPLFVNPAAGDFTLQSGSPARDAGASIASLFTFDKNNVTRPQNGTWDIGPYEFVTGASASPTATITAPTSGTTYSTGTTPLTTLAGGATDDVGVTSVTWACPTCTPTSGTASCATCGAAATAPSWSVGSIGLASGDNVITVTAHDGDTQTGTDVLTVTLTAGADITSNLVAHWKLDENTGTTPQDSAGTNHGTFVTTPTWVSPGKLGLAMLDFDGTGDRVDVGNGAALNPTGSWTMAAWVRTDLATTVQNVLTKNVADVGNQYSLQWRSTQRVRCTAPNNPQTTLDSSTNLNAATWYHVACVSNGTDLRVYINGALDSTPAAATGSAAANGATVLLGSSRNTPALPFDGQLDDIRLYARALSAGDIAALAALTNPPTVTITAPTSSATYSTSTTPLTTLAGSPTGATDDVGVLSVTWSCPTCTPTSGTATCASCGAAATSVAWSVSSIGLAAGDNVITCTATDAESQTGTDQLTVTYTPPASTAVTPFRLMR